ncbi:MAG: hypothetical protein RR365_15425 [Bacteroides sp.]
MASGCIIGECPVCGEIVWEDDWDIVGDIIIHETCRKAYFKAKYHISEQQFNRLMGAEELRKDIAEAKTHFAADIKLLEEGYGHQIAELEKRLKHLEKNKTSGSVATACERAAKRGTQ